MLPLIFAHLIAFFLLFAFGIPASGAILHSQAYGFTGGYMAAALLSLACEVVMFIGAYLGKLCVDALNINPLFQTVKSRSISAILIAAVTLPLLLLASHLSFVGLTLTLGSASATTFVMVAALFAMFEVQRFYVTHFVKG